MERKKLGLFGGTFDPIHNGHLITASDIKNKLGLEKIIFIPTYVPPHKIGEAVTSAADRYAMVELAIKGCPGFAISDIEIKREGISYTYDTIKSFHDEYGENYDLFFIVGADSVGELETWHKIKETLQLSTFVAADRPGFAPTVEKVIASFGELGKKKIIWVDTPDIDISSTDIREKIKKNISIDKLVPVAVAEYIRQKDLYRW